jgi:2-dehydropantoate 2-reductase
MRILVVGAGAIGGYFGGRLLDAGRDVTFLVRQRRAAELAKTGLVIQSPQGDMTIPSPPTVLAEALREKFDLILLSCKAYDLEGALDSVAPAVGPQTAILPLLNGMRHLDVLEQRFGAAAVLGGLCVIGTTLDAEGRVVHLNDLHSLTFGERDGSRSPRAEAIAAALTGARFEVKLSETILQEMWEKFVFIATGAGITSLMRGTIGDIVAAGAAHLPSALLDECAAIATREGFPPAAPFLQRVRTMFTASGSGLTTSMFRDIERGAPTEADHILGDLLRRAGTKADAVSVLGIAFAHVKTYEARRARLQAAAKAA